MLLTWSPPPPRRPACQRSREWAALRQQPAVGTARLNAALSSSEARSEDSQRNNEIIRGGGGCSQILSNAPTSEQSFKKISPREKEKEQQKMMEANEAEAAISMSEGARRPQRELQPPAAPHLPPATEGSKRYPNTPLKSPVSKNVPCGHSSD